MLGLSPLQFLRAILAGFFATFVMTVVGYWQRGLGLPRVDAADILAQNADRSKLWGSYAHYMTGIILALGYARWFEPLLRGQAALRGLFYGLGTTLLADGLVMPLVDPRVGPFFGKTPRPSLLRTASLMVHLAYGLTLGLFYADRPGKGEAKAEDAWAGSLPKRKAHLEEGLRLWKLNLVRSSASPREN